MVLGFFLTSLLSLKKIVCLCIFLLHLRVAADFEVSDYYLGFFYGCYHLLKKE